MPCGNTKGALLLEESPRVFVPTESVLGTARLSAGVQRDVDAIKVVQELWRVATRHADKATLGDANLAAHILVNISARRTRIAIPVQHVVTRGLWSPKNAAVEVYIDELKKRQQRPHLVHTRVLTNFVLSVSMKGPRDARSSKGGVWRQTLLESLPILLAEPPREKDIDDIVHVPFVVDMHLLSTRKLEI